jgi:hypothetical protein
MLHILRINSLTNDVTVRDGDDVCHTISRVHDRARQ